MEISVNFNWQIMNSYIAIPNFEFYEQNVTLDDFELIRCIGHGAYGQVKYF